MLAEERERLRETDPFTVLEYIKTSIEILMNMKMEEHEAEIEKKKKATRSKNRSSKLSEGGGLLESVDPEDIESSSEMGKTDRINDYDSMLQKYEAEVRNHIKVEQQLKLHIECIQDKLDDTEKQMRKDSDERVVEKEEVKLELDRYKELLNLREKEI